MQQQQHQGQRFEHARNSLDDQYSMSSFGQSDEQSSISSARPGHDNHLRLPQRLSDNAMQQAESHYHHSLPSGLARSPMPSESPESAVSGGLPYRGVRASPDVNLLGLTISVGDSEMARLHALPPSEAASMLSPAPPLFESPAPVGARGSSGGGGGGGNGLGAPLFPFVPLSPMGPIPRLSSTGHNGFTRLSSAGGALAVPAAGTLSVGGQLTSHTLLSPLAPGAGPHDASASPEPLMDMSSRRPSLGLPETVGHSIQPLMVWGNGL